MRRFAYIVLALAMACTESIPVQLPVEPDHASLLIVREGTGFPILFALEPGQRPPPLGITSGADVVLIAYPGALADYGLEPGRVTAEVDPEAGRPVPAGALTYAWQSVERQWNEVAPRPDFVDDLRLEEPSTCDAPNACWHFFEDRLVCGQPCPTPSDVAAPPAVAGPTAWSPTCAEGFAIDGSGRCRPATRRTCPAGQVQRLEDAQCAPLVACPGTPWRGAANPVGAEVYVDLAAAPNGNGTTGSPYDSIAAALAATTGPATLFLSAGQHSVPAIDDTIVLRGTCPAETTLVGAPTIGAAADVTFDGVLLSINSFTTAGDVRVVDTVVDGPQITATGALVVERTHFVAGALQSAGAATIDDVVFEATVAAAITVTGGTSNVSRAVFFDAPALRVTGGEAEVARVWLDAANAPPAFVVEGGRAEVSGSAFVTHSFAAVNAGAELSATDVDVVHGPVASSVAGTLAFVRARIGDTSRGTLFAAEGDASLTLDRVSIEGASGDVVEAEGAAQIVLRDVDASGVATLVDLFGTSSLDLDRVVSSGRVRAGAARSTEIFPLPGVSNVCLEGFAPETPSRATMTIDDLTLLGPLTTGIAPCAGTTATIRNVVVRDAMTAIGADCRGNCADDALVPSVDIDGLTVEGESSGRIGVIIRSGTLTLKRAAIADVELYGLYVWGADANVEDLTVDGTGANVPDDALERDVYCSENRGGGNLRGPGSAFFAEAWSSQLALSEGEAFIERFSFTNSGCAGISMGVDGMFTATDGAITNNLRGLNYLRFGEPIVGEDVVFRDNSQADVYRVALD
ncbi:MAG: hypothetical protein RIT81_00290 [Deltaproteobacteria bacterium]